MSTCAPFLTSTPILSAVADAIVPDELGIVPPELANPAIAAAMSAVKTVAETALFASMQVRKSGQEWYLRYDDSIYPFVNTPDGVELRVPDAAETFPAQCSTWSKPCHKIYSVSTDGRVVGDGFISEPLPEFADFISIKAYDDGELVVLAVLTVANLWVLDSREGEWRSVEREATEFPELSRIEVCYDGDEVVLLHSFISDGHSYVMQMLESTEEGWQSNKYRYYDAVIRDMAVIGSTALLCDGTNKLVLVETGFISTQQVIDVNSFSDLRHQTVYSVAADTDTFAATCSDGTVFWLNRGGFDVVKIFVPPIYKSVSKILDQCRTLYSPCFREMAAALKVAAEKVMMTMVQAIVPRLRLSDELLPVAKETMKVAFRETGNPILIEYLIKNYKNPVPSNLRDAIVGHRWNHNLKKVVEMMCYYHQKNVHASATSQSGENAFRRLIADCAAQKTDLFYRVAEAMLDNHCAIARNSLCELANTIEPELWLMDKMITAGADVNWCNPEDGCMAMHAMDYNSISLLRNCLKHGYKLDEFDGRRLLKHLHDDMDKAQWIWTFMAHDAIKADQLNEEEGNPQLEFMYEEWKATTKYVKPIRETVHTLMLVECRLKESNILRLPLLPIEIWRYILEVMPLEPQEWVGTAAFNRWANGGCAI